VVANANIYQVPQMSATLESGHRLLQGVQAAKAQNREIPRGWSDPTYLDDLILDHNHLMHLFLIRLPQMDRFLHLHPERTDDGQFVVRLPNLAAGRYQIFADVVHQTGFPTTMIGEVELPAVAGKLGAGDDSEWAGPPILPGANASPKCSLPDGGQMIWERPATPLKAGMLTAFRFRVEDAEGKPVQDLQPYMGMAAHAEFVRSDLAVFAHVHPAGSVPMAALELAQAGLSEYGGQAQSSMPDMAMPQAALSPEVSFPYGFPKPGDYRLFIQVKRAGRVETGVFDAHVE